MITKLKYIKRNWLIWKTKHLFEPLAEIIMIFIQNARTDREFHLGCYMGNFLDWYCVSKGIYLFGITYE